MKAGLVEARKLRFNRRADGALSARRRILLGTVVLRRIQVMQYGELIRGMHRGLLNHISFVFPAEGAVGAAVVLSFSATVFADRAFRRRKPDAMVWLLAFPRPCARGSL